MSVGIGWYFGPEIGEIQCGTIDGCLLQVFILDLGSNMGYLDMRKLYYCTSVVLHCYAECVRSKNGPFMVCLGFVLILDEWVYWDWRDGICARIGVWGKLECEIYFYISSCILIVAWVLFQEFTRGGLIEL